jgi:hypothetical protein
MIGIAIGLLCLSIGVLFLLRRFLKSSQKLAPYFNKLDELRKTGERVSATVTDIKVGNISSSRPTYILSAQWHDPKKDRIYTFSTPIPDPDKFPIGSSVPFLIDPNDPNYHFPQFLLEGK